MVPRAVFSCSRKRQTRVSRFLAASAWRSATPLRLPTSLRRAVRRAVRRAGNADNKPDPLFPKTAYSAVEYPRLGVALRSVDLVFGSSRVKTVDVPKIGEPGIFGTAVDCCG